MNVRTLIILVAACSLYVSGIAQARQPLILRAASYVGPDGSLIDNPIVRIHAGVIEDVRTTGEAPAGAVDFPGAVISPGLIDIHSELTAAGRNAESANVIEPEADAAHLLDRHHRDLQLLLSRGVTTAVIAPAGVNLVAGRTAVVSTWVPPSGKMTVAPGPMKLSLSPAAFQPDREPTSTAGALELLRRTFDAAIERGGDDPLALLAGGRLPVIAECPQRSDVIAMLQFAERYSLRMHLIHREDLLDIAPRLAGRAELHIVPTLDMSAPFRILAGPAALHRAGVEVVFAGMTPQQHPDALRTSAALAVRFGLPPEAARRAMTISPARIAEIADVRGSIEAGRAADLVVFSADPLRLDARIIAVFVAGELVFGDPAILAHANPGGGT